MAARVLYEPQASLVFFLKFVAMPIHKSNPKLLKIFKHTVEYDRISWKKFKHQENRDCFAQLLILCFHIALELVELGLTLPSIC